MRTTESRQSVLIDVARRLSSAGDLDELVDHILKRSREVMDCEVCSILLPDAANGDLIIRSTLDAVGSGQVRVPKGKGIAGEVYVTKQLVNSQDAGSDPRHFKPSSDKSGLVTRAMLTAPLLDGGRCLGVMQAINPQHEPFFSEQDEEMIQTFGSLIAVTLMRLDAQRKAIRDAEVRQEMSLAREIQKSFLPSPSARIGSVGIEAFYHPASDVGGDFYFWHEAGDGKILVGVGDVCGKGLPAALDMARSTTLIASMAHLCATMPLGGWMSALNARLCGAMRAGRFIAINALVIDPARDSVQLCGAGLPTPKVRDAGGWRDALMQGNPPLGISPRVVYRSSEHGLGTGGRCLVFTDGILEVQNRRGEHFEDGAFALALEHLADAAHGAVVSGIADAWQGFATDAAYEDDATLLLITHEAPAPPAAVSLKCEPGALKDARAFIEQWVAHCRFDEKTSGLVVLGCDEVLSNLCKHACCATAALSAEALDGELRIRIQHHGEGITNEEFQRLVSVPSHGDRVGGLGLYVISQIFDRTDFRKGEGGSTIELVKRVEAMQ
ncbi:MAG: SpoIIE family protein phosphatase [Verrucomicrobiaceae bacterium]|nr:SpoIIE family protein phosphatase [Verrucomicrobiaceae bacterium]